MVQPIGCTIFGFIIIDLSFLYHNFEFFMRAQVNREVP